MLKVKLFLAVVVLAFVGACELLGRDEAEIEEGGNMICYYPRECSVVDTEYSSGGSSKIIHLVEVGCQLPDGTYVKYIDRVFKWGGALGIGRVLVPSKIVFKPWDKDELKCE